MTARAWHAALVIVSTACTVSAWGGEPSFRSTAVFPAEAMHNHASCVVELAGGDLLLAWYRGSGERSADDVRIMGARLAKGADRWSAPFVMADTPGYPDCNPSLFAAPDRTIWLFWPTVLDHRWEGALLKFATAPDDGKAEGPPTWTREGVVHVTPEGFEQDMAAAVETVPKADAERYSRVLARVSERSRDLLYQRLGWMPRVHPVALPSGRWLLPLYCDTFSASIMVSSDDRGATWSTSKPLLGFGSIQPSLVRKDDGSIVAFMRDNGPFRRVRVATSGDEGRTWGPVTSAALPNPGSGLEAVRLASGRWLMVYNDTERGRHSLAVSLSDDQGATWPRTRHLEARPVGQGSFSYPSVVQSRDGLIHVTYSHDTRPAGQTVQHARFDEAWVVQGDPPAGP